MNNSPESSPQPESPRVVLERLLDGEPIGSPKWQRIADHFALMRVDGELTGYHSNPQAYSEVYEQKLIAAQAQIQETIRTRMFGPDAIAYRQAGDDLIAITKVYRNKYKDYEDLTDSRAKSTISAAVEADLEDILTGLIS